MRQNGIVTDGQAAETTLTGSEELRIIESPGETHRFKKCSINQLRGGDIVTLTASLSITEALHRNRTCLLGEVGGNAALVATLPAATGSGAIYTFVVSVVNTSGYFIRTAAAELFVGSILQYSAGDGATAPRLWSASAVTDSDEITLNGTTSGGQQIGDKIVIQDIATDTWAVQGWVHASGTEITPWTHEPSSSPSSSVSSSASASVSSSPSTSVSSSPSSSVSSSPSSSPSSSVSSSVSPSGGSSFSASVSSSPSTSVSSSVSSSPSTSVSSSPSTSASSSVSSSPSTSVSSSPSTSVSSSPSSSPSTSVSNSPSSSPS